MKARLVRFGEIEVEGQRYTHDVVIDGGKVRKRKKGPSKQFREKFGHTPLSIDEKLPWKCRRLVIGTGAGGALPVMRAVRREAESHGVELMLLRTPEAIKVLEKSRRDVNAVLHITC